MPFTLCSNVTPGSEEDYVWEETILYNEDINILLCQPRATGIRCVLRKFDGNTGLALVATDSNGDTLESANDLVALSCPPSNHQGGEFREPGQT